MDRRRTKKALQEAKYSLLRIMGVLFWNGAILNTSVGLKEFMLLKAFKTLVLFRYAYNVSFRVQVWASVSLTLMFGNNLM